MGEVHQLLLDYGKRAALDSEFDRTVVEAAAAYLANEDTEIGFIYSGWCQAALPHKRLPDNEAWQLKTDHLTLMLAPGHRPSDDGPPIAIGVPFGSRARLILIYLQSEALRTQSREIELGRSLNGQNLYGDFSVKRIPSCAFLISLELSRARSRGVARLR